MPPKNSGGSTKFPGGQKVIHRTAQTAFVRVVNPRRDCVSWILDDQACYSLVGFYHGASP